MLYLSIVVAIISAAIATILIVRRPENAVSVIAALSIVFGVLPAIMITFGSSFNFYSYRSFLATSSYLFSPHLTAPALLIFSLSTLFLCLGGMWGLARPRSLASQRDKNKTISNASFFAAAFLLMTLWAILIGREWLMSGLSFFQFFTPSVRTDRLSYTPGFLYATMMTIPVALMIASRWLERGRNLYFVGFLLIALITCFSTHQRREIVTVILAAASVVMIRSPGAIQRDARTSLKHARKVIIGGLAAGLAAVPLFWYARVFFTSLSRGQIVDPFSVRGIEEVIFGSPATAFGAYVLIHDKIARWGAEPVAFFARIASIPIPRAMWPNKPGDLDTVLQESYSLYENPSIFWIGDLYNAFGLFSIFVAGLFGYIVARWHATDTSSASMFNQARAVAFLCLCIVLFKNGFAIFLMRFVVLAGLLYLLWAMSGIRFIARPSYSPFSAIDRLP